jgi:hypothetical protein
MRPRTPSLLHPAVHCLASTYERVGDPSTKQPTQQLNMLSHCTRYSTTALLLPRGTPRRVRLRLIARITPCGNDLPHRPHISSHARPASSRSIDDVSSCVSCVHASHRLWLGPSLHTKGCQTDANGTLPCQAQGHICTCMLRSCQRPDQMPPCVRPSHPLHCFTPRDMSLTAMWASHTAADCRQPWLTAKEGHV